MSRKVSPNFSKAKHTLAKAVQCEIERRLHYSLHNRIFLTLELQEDCNRVNPLEAIEVKIGTEDNTTRLENNINIVDLCDRAEMGGRLLILGAPGAGKTTTLLNLAKVLVARSLIENTPIPILLSLSAWKEDKQSIRDWIITQLKEKYGLRKDIGKYWVNTGTIFPFLDGLDEVKPKRQECCVKAINTFLQEWPNRVIVCSRIEEHDRLQIRLRLNSAIVLQPLNEALIYDYIQRTNEPSLWDNICNDANLRDLMKTPLLLNIIVLACEKFSLAKWQELDSSEERLDCLFEAYIEEMLTRSSHKQWQYNEKETKHWLGYLARQLIEENITEFYIEKMQPSWLETRQQKFINGLIYGSIYGSSFGVAIAMIHNLINGLLVILGYGLLNGLFSGLFCMRFRFGKIEPVENISFSFQVLRKKFLKSFGIGLLCGSISIMIGSLWAIDWQHNNLDIVLISSLILSLTLGLICGFLFGIISGFFNTEIENKTIPNQGIKRSVLNSIIVFIIGCFLISILLISFLSISIKSLILVKFLMMPILLMIFSGITMVGGLAAIQHLALRFALTQSNKIPWDYARFLNYSVDRLFLQRVGGSYRFLHDLLRQHFARKYG